MGWSASAPPVLATCGVSRRPATIKPPLVASLARVRSGGRGRTDFLLVGPALTEPLGLSHLTRKSRVVGGAGGGAVTVCDFFAF